MKVDGFVEEFCQQLRMYDINTCTCLIKYDMVS